MTFNIQNSIKKNLKEKSQMNEIYYYITIFLEEI